MSDVVLNGSLVDSEEFTSNEDLFHPINISPQSAINKHGTEPSANPTLGAAALLDDYSGDEDGDDSLNNDEDRDNGPNDNQDRDDDLDSDRDNETLEVIAVGITADEMDIDEGIKMPRLPHDGCRTVARSFQAGCVWARNDWSCAYDTVFMAFFTIYWQSSAS